MYVKIFEIIIIIQNPLKTTVVYIADVYQRKLKRFCNDNVVILINYSEQSYR